MLSVMIITKNEEANIARCLQSVSFADEVIVLDSGSTDKTLAIARQFTDKVFVNTDWQGYGIQKQRALKEVTGDWVLNLDADEMVDEKLRQSILQAIVSDKADAYRIPIVMVFYNKALRFSYSPVRHIRLFKQKGANYCQSLVHEKIILAPHSRIAQLKEPILHRSFQDLHHALTKLNQYSSHSAKMRLEKKRVPPFSWVLLKSIWMFLRCYFFKCGFLDGKAGFFLAVYNATGTWYRGMKQIYQDKPSQ